MGLDASSLHEPVEKFEGSAGLTSVTIKDVKTGDVTILDVQAALVAIGHIPNTLFVKDVLPRDDQGYIERLDNHGSTHTGAFPDNR